MSLKGRLRRVEEHAVACGQCYLEPQRPHVFYLEDGEPEPEVPACSDCGRPLGYVIRVVYEGEGVIPIG